MFILHRWANIKQNVLPVKSVNNIMMDLMPKKLWESKLHYTNCQYYTIHPQVELFFTDFPRIRLRLAASVVFLTAGVKKWHFARLYTTKKRQKNIETQSMFSSRGAKTTGHECQGRKKPFRWKTCIQRRTRAIEKRTRTKPLAAATRLKKRKGDFTSEFSGSSAAVRVEAVRIKCPCSRLPRRTRSPGRIPDSTSLAPLKRAERECLSSR